MADGRNYNEPSVLDFGGTLVKLTGITFAHVDTNDLFDVFTSGDGVAAG